MGSPRSGNLERAKWRTKCRQELSKHIRKNLGVTIDPSEVRLIPGFDDLYSWKALPGMKHLFEKHLSKHSIGAYMELCREVGLSFEAVFANNVHPPGVEASFTARIKELQEDNSRLVQELNQWKLQAHTELTLKELAEGKVEQVTATIQAADAEKQHLGQEVERLAMTADYFRGCLSKSFSGVNKAFSLLEKMKLELSSVSEEDLEWMRLQDIQDIDEAGMGITYTAEESGHLYKPGNY